MSESTSPIRSFKDLNVYQNTYNAMLIVMSEIIPQLPDHEKYDLRSQLSRACKSIPRLIAEGYAKRHQKAGFQKYLDDAMAESNEMIVSLEQGKDIYKIESKTVSMDGLIDMYDKAGRQLYNLSMAWTNFKSKGRSQP